MAGYITILQFSRVPQLSKLFERDTRHIRDVRLISLSVQLILNKNFITDIEHWKETIRTNCYDNFELNSCKILNEAYEGEGEAQIATVTFVAKMTQVDSNEKTAFQETSTFERGGKNICGGAWLYKSGVIETAPGMPDAVEAKNLDEELKAKQDQRVVVKVDT